MLSPPPAAFAARTSSIAAASSRRNGRTIAAIALADHLRQAVGAEQEDVAGRDLGDERVEVGVAVAAERAGKHVAQRVVTRLLGVIRPRPAARRP